MGGYILLRSNAGLCDSMFMLEMLTPYAKKYNRTIVWDLVLYSASDMTSIFELSTYPVNVLYGIKHIANINFSHIEPSCFGRNMYTIPRHTGPNLFNINGQSAQFDMTKEYPDSTLLIYFGGLGGWVTMDNIRFNKKLIDEYHTKISQLPEKFDAVHLRATDHFDQNRENDLNKVCNFVKDKTNVYLATDNMALMDSLSEKFPQIIKAFSYKKDYKLQRSLHHDYGNCDPDLSKKAILDILICASSNSFLQSTGGFSRLIRHLHQNKELLKSLTSTVDLPQPEVKKKSDSCEEVQTLTSTVDLPQPDVEQITDSCEEVQTLTLEVDLPQPDVEQISDSCEEDQNTNLQLTLHQLD